VLRAKLQGTRIKVEVKVEAAELVEMVEWVFNLEH